MTSLSLLVGRTVAGLQLVPGFYKKIKGSTEARKTSLDIVIFLTRDTYSKYGLHYAVGMLKSNEMTSSPLI